MSPVDSGEYVCRVVGGSVPLEASVRVTIESVGSVPGEWYWARGRERRAGMGRLRAQPGEASTPAMAGSHETKAPTFTHPHFLLPFQPGIDPLLSVPSAWSYPPNPD